MSLHTKSTRKGYTQCGPVYLTRYLIPRLVCNVFVSDKLDETAYKYKLVMSYWDNCCTYLCMCVLPLSNSSVSIKFGLAYPKLMWFVAFRHHNLALQCCRIIVIIVTLVGQ